jgi:predicted methyltransferase
MKINEIYLGDCLELMKDIPNGTIDMILCDLPYGTTACKWDVINAKIKAVLMAFYRPLSDVLMFEILTEENENYESK